METAAQMAPDSIEDDPLASLEDRIRRAVELVAELRTERDGAVADADSARKTASAAKAEANKLREELEGLRGERKQVRARIEGLLGQIETLQ